ncbi:protein RD3 isoform X3 [Narcine bancroftii]|uniref:protein RD3 isoform X3 n=1 Tax=Narcine bancroftii TaxID=1343680 RepID=UPI003831590E
MSISSWFKWNEPYHRLMKRSPTDMVVETLMMELSWQIKQAEKMQRQREDESRRIKTGVDYSWLVSHPHHSYDVTPGARLELEEVCSKINPSYCGPVVLRFRQLIEEYEPDVQEVVQLFRFVLMDATERMKEDQETRKLIRQWSKKRTVEHPSIPKEGYSTGGTDLLALHQCSDHWNDSSLFLMRPTTMCHPHT